MIRYELIWFWYMYSYRISFFWFYTWDNKIVMYSLDSLKQSLWQKRPWLHVQILHALHFFWMSIKLDDFFRVHSGCTKVSRTGKFWEYIMSVFQIIMMFTKPIYVYIYICVYIIFWNHHFVCLENSPFGLEKTHRISAQHPQILPQRRWTVWAASALNLTVAASRVGGPRAEVSPRWNPEKRSFWNEKMWVFGS